MRSVKKENQVTVGGKSCRLTPLEYEVYQLLKLNQGDTLSRDLLLKEVWGYLSEADTDIFVPDFEKTEIEILHAAFSVYFFVYVSVRIGKRPDYFSVGFRSAYDVMPFCFAACGDSVFFVFGFLTVELFGRIIEGCSDKRPVASDAYSVKGCVEIQGFRLNLINRHLILFPVNIEINAQIILTYLPVSALYILSMAIGYLGLRYIELSISSPICNSSGAIVAILIFATPSTKMLMNSHVGTASGVLMSTWIKLSGSLSTL